MNGAAFSSGIRPPARSLAPGASRAYGVRFLLADQIRCIEETLVAHQRPVAVGIPGYVLPGPGSEALLKAESKVTAIAARAPEAITVSEEKPTAGGWRASALRGKTWGRARLLVKYANGDQQSISYYVTKPAAQAVADLGNFPASRQWFVDPRIPLDAALQ
jgi:hypothetical protein